MRCGLRSLRVLFYLLAAGACHRESTAPDREPAFSVRYGGGVSEMRVGPASIYFQVRCDTFDGKRPVPDADGRFVLALEPRPQNWSLHATLRGKISGDSISGIVDVVYPTGVRKDTVRIVRGVPPNYQVLSCRIPP